jgi:hypothetical protein
MSFGRIDDAKRGVTSLSHPDLRLTVKVVVLDPGDVGVCTFVTPGNPIVIRVLSGHLTVILDGDRHELIEGDSLHGTRPGSLAWEGGDEGRSTSLWVTVAAGAADQS